MKNKSRDTAYCGVDAKRIQTRQLNWNAQNMRRLHTFICERYKIHLRKDVYKLPAPWTEDPVLAEFRFTNIRREHDRETLWLINNITSNPRLSYENKLLNCFLFRLFNKHETAELIGMPIEFYDKEGNPQYKPEAYRTVFYKARWKDPKRVFFTNAFITGGLKRALKWYLPQDDPSNSMEMRVMHFMRHLIQEGLVQSIQSDNIKTPQDCFNLLRNFMGIGDFLAYQIFVDYTYIAEFPFSENEFVVAGPGCKAGLRCLFPDLRGLTYEEALFWLRDNLDHIFKKLKLDWQPEELFVDLPEYDRCMNIMSLENCMCEISKYIRALDGTGRPRNKYKAHKEEI